MPLYTYQCNDCKDQFEVLYFSGDPNPVCPKCGSSETERIVIGSRCFSCPGQGSSSCSGSCATCPGCHH